MTEKEKRDLGLLYDPNYDPELQSEVLRMNDLCHKFNKLRPSARAKQERLLRKMLGRVGKCPAANRRAAIILAAIRTPVDGSSCFLANIFHKTNATKDIQKRRSIISSITPPYITDAIKYGIVGFTVYESIIICE